MGVAQLSRTAVAETARVHCCVCVPGWWTLAPMGLTVNVTRLDESVPVVAGRPKDDPDSRDALELARCDVIDDEHWSFGPSFEYLISRRSDDGVDVQLVGMRVGGPHGAPGHIALGTSISEIRDMPLARWEQAARASLTMKYGAPPAANRAQSAQGGTPEDVIARVFELFPELRDDHTPAGRRRFKSLSRLARLAYQYMQLVAEGRGDPSAELARQLDESPATVRSWIHRARKVGLLGAAVGRTAGVAASRNLQRATDQGEARLEMLQRRFAELDARLESLPPSTQEGLDPAERDLIAQAEEDRQRVGDEVEKMTAAIASVQKELATIHLDADVAEFADVHERIERADRERRGEKP